MVKLGKAGSHFSASRAGSSDDDQWLCSFDILIFSVAFIADNVSDIVGIAFDGIVAVNLDAQLLKLGAEQIRRRLTGVAGDYNTSHIKPFITEFLNQTKNVYIIGDSQIVADFIFFNVSGIDGNDDLCLVGKLKQHLQLAVRSKARKDSGSVIVVKQLSAEFQI